ncbi:FAD-binding oxidoreductase [Niveibacterium terrae]|uniref:FAD-binding oxidoreductase n=1 Tax=Niveibacterium terrae TaxID=3373598 RepID=UPI003A93EB92
MNDLLAALSSIVGEANVLRSTEQCAPYLNDWRGRYHGRCLAVVKPASTAQVAAVVKACAAASVPIVPQGGNTGHCGGATPDASGAEVVVALGRMNHIREVDVGNSTITVEAGCTLAAVQDAAEAAGRLFPLSLAAEGSCQIGGNLSTNAGGVHVLRYGTARELVLGLEVVLADGEVWSSLRGLRKDNTGYDLKQLFLGAEGTLGLITAAVLKLFPAPRSRSLAWVALPDPVAAVQLLGDIRAAAGERLSAFELISRQTLELVLAHCEGARDPLDQPSPWYALIELADSAEGAELGPIFENVLGAAIEMELASDAVIALSASQIEALWALRENAAEAQKREGVSIKHDISVPVSRIPDFLERAGEALAAAFPGIRIIAFGHVGDGNLHYNCFGPVEAPSLIEQSEKVNRIVYDIVAALDGSISAEHGIGQLKRDELVRYKSPLEIELMRRIKKAFDPAGLMNPGKLL